MTSRRLAALTWGTCLLLALGTLLLLALDADVSTRADSRGLSGVLAAAQVSLWLRETGR